MDRLRNFPSKNATIFSSGMGFNVFKKKTIKIIDFLFILMAPEWMEKLRNYLLFVLATHANIIRRKKKNSNKERNKTICKWHTENICAFLFLYFDKILWHGWENSYLNIVMFLHLKKKVKIFFVFFSFLLHFCSSVMCLFCVYETIVGMGFCYYQFCVLFLLLFSYEYDTIKPYGFFFLSWLLFFFFSRFVL